MTLTVRGMSLTFAVCHGRKMYVPLEGRWLQLIIEHIASESLQEGVEPSPDFVALLRKSDRPFIGWRSASLGADVHGNWYMRFQAQDGSKRLGSAGFRVPRMDLSGQIYSASDALHAVRQVLHRVKMRWNERDCSDRARFDV